MSEPWERRWRATYPLGTAIAKVVFDFEVVGRERLPDGPVVIAANHFSHVDPPFVGAAVRRPVKFMAAADLQGINRPLDFFLGFYGSIPLPRSGVPLGAMRAALRHLDTGGAVGVFPEGRRVPYWGETEPRQGAAWLALRRGVPLVPVALVGTDRVMPLEAQRLHRAPVSAHILPALEPVGTRAELTARWVSAMDSVLGA